MPGRLPSLSIGATFMLVLMLWYDNSQNLTSRLNLCSSSI